MLATAEESLDLLSRLAASLLDVTRLQAGARSVFPRPAYLEEIITGALAGLAPQARSVRVVLPPGLPEVLADPPIGGVAVPSVVAVSPKWGGRDGIEQRYHVHGAGPVCVVHPGGPGLSWDHMRLPGLESSNTMVRWCPVSVKMATSQLMCR